MAINVSGRSAKDLRIEGIDSATYSKMDKFLNATNSAGTFTGGIITDSGSGQVDVSAAKGVIRVTNSDVAQLIAFDIDATTDLSLTDNSINYIYIDYNAGIPVWAVTTTYTDINLQTEIIVGRVYRSGTKLWIGSFGQKIQDATLRDLYRLQTIRRFEHASGDALSTPADRNIAVTAGVYFANYEKIDTAAVDTSGAGKFDSWYRNGSGGWSRTVDQTQIDNANYDDGTGVLNSLDGVNHYGVHWVYRCVDGTLHVQYGQASYSSLESARLSTVPTAPTMLQWLGILIGRVIIKNAATTITEVSSAFTTTFVASAPALHSDLANLDYASAGHTGFAAIDAPVPTTIVSTVASKGGIFNGGFESVPTYTADQTNSGWMAGAAAGSSTDDRYGWYVYRATTACAARFDPTVSHSGGASIRLSTTDITGTIYALNTHTTVSLSNMKKYYIPIKPSTKYRLSVWCKTYNVAALAAYCAIVQYDSSAVVGTTVQSSKLSGTNDWTLLSTDFTSDSDAAYALVRVYNFVAGNIGDAWYDELKLEEVIEDTSNTSLLPAPLLSTITGVNSTDNIDQSLDTGGAYANTYALTNAINEGATHLQTFLPIRNKITQIGVWVVEAGTGVDWKLEIHDASNNIIAANTILAAALVEGAFNYFNVPCLWSSGNYHFHVYASATTGTPTCKVNTSNDLETASYIQYYAAPTEKASIICNGEKISLSTDEDGLLTGAIIDLDKGIYFYKFTASESNYQKFANDVYSASTWAYAFAYPTAINGFPYNASNLYSSTANTPIVLKVNTMLPIKHLFISLSTLADGTYQTHLEISPDNNTYTRLISAPTSGGNVVISGDSDLCNGTTTFYIKMIPETGKNFEFHGLVINATLDISYIKLPIIYPLATNQFTEEVVMPSTASRVYYRTGKYINTNGVIIPHLEFTDASANVLKTIPCKLDNTGETSPAIDIIIADTTYGQQSGTGSADSTTGYILNDGEYMTFSTATQYAKMVYKVGGGTTSFSNITKNRIYLSSDGVIPTYTKDQSMQMGVSLWYRVQSVARTISDITQKFNDLILPKFNVSYVADGGTVNHQLGRVPSIVIAIATTSAEFISVTAKDALTFTVAIKKHDGTAGTTQTIYWMAI